MGDTYTVSVACSNCGWRGSIEIPKGQLIEGKTCPNCGCYELEKR